MNESGALPTGNDKVGAVRDDKPVRMVYSIMHGYMIPVVEEADDDTSALYNKILGELREENGYDEKAAAKAERAQRKTLVEQFVPADDPLTTCACESRLMVLALTHARGHDVFGCCRLHPPSQGLQGRTVSKLAPLLLCTLTKSTGTPWCACRCLCCTVCS